MGFLRKGKRYSSNLGLEDDRSPFTQPGFIASALLLLFVIICFGLIVFDNRRSSPGSGTNAGASRSTTTVTESPIDAGVDSVEPCPPGAVQSGDRPVTAPAGVRWENYRTLALPYSVTDGPMRIQGEVARCFSRTPTGALLALAHISARYILSPDWNNVVKYQIVPSPEVETYRLTRRGQELQMGGPSLPEPGTVTQLAGFRFISYTNESAVLAIVRRDSQGRLESFFQTVEWESGDWKLVLQSGGVDSTSTEPVDSLTGFVPWRDVRR